jgi:hypothetical protein
MSVSAFVSCNFPRLPATDIAGCVIDMTTVDHASPLRRFRTWLHSSNEARQGEDHRNVASDCFGLAPAVPLPVGRGIIR